MVWENDKQSIKVMNDATRQGSNINKTTTYIVNIAVQITRKYLLGNADFRRKFGQFEDKRHLIYCQIFDQVMVQANL